MKHHYFLVVLLLLSTIKSHSQNLVPNHSFEEYNTCPPLSYYGHYLLFNENFNDWHIPFFHTGTSDYFNACQPLYYQHAQHGQGYIGLIAYSENGMAQPIREYVMTELTSTLEKGVNYTLSMWVLGRNNDNLAINGLGMAFLSDIQMQSFPTQRTYSFVNGIPPALIAQQVVTDKINWVQLKTTYIAKGDEKYILLGNLLSDSQTVSIPKYRNVGDRAYYFIDNITVMKTSEYIASNKEIDKKSFTVYPNPATDIINIESEDELVKSIEINDVNGRLIPLNSINNQTIDISSLASGTYFVKIKSDKGVEVHKVVKK